MTGEVWIGLEQNIIDTAVNKRRNHLCSCCPDTLNIFHCRQLKNGQSDELSAQVTEMWKNVFYVLFWLRNDAPLDKNTISCWFCFRQVVQKQTVGAVGN